MGDEEDGHAEFALEVLQQRQDLRLHGHVEGGGRFVGDEQVRLVGERHGDHDALALAAGELVRIGVEPAGGIGNADAAKPFGRLRPCGLGRQALVEDERLGHLLPDRVQRVQRGHRLLEDDAHRIAAHLADRRIVCGDEVLPLEEQAARGMRGCRIGQELHHREGGDGFARAALADDGERLAAVDVERDAVDGEALPPALAEGDGEVLDGEEGRVGGHGMAVRKRCMSNGMSGFR